LLHRQFRVEMNAKIAYDVCCVDRRFADGQCTILRRQLADGSTGPEPDRFCFVRIQLP